MKLKYAEGHVYVIHGAGRYKIGRTASSVQRRLLALQCASPVPLTLICAIKTRNAPSLEKQLHIRFAHLQDATAGREWFHLSESDVNYLAGLSIPSNTQEPEKTLSEVSDLVLRVTPQLEVNTLGLGERCKYGISFP